MHIIESVVIWMAPPRGPTARRSDPAPVVVHVEQDIHRELPGWQPASISTSTPISRWSIRPPSGSTASSTSGSTSSPNGLFDLAEIAFERVGLSRSYADAGKIKEKLQPAIDELEGKGFLRPLSRDERYVKEGKAWRSASSSSPPPSARRRRPGPPPSRSRPSSPSWSSAA